MATRRPHDPDDSGEEDEATAFDVGRKIASNNASNSKRPADSSKASSKASKSSKQPRAPAPATKVPEASEVPLHLSESAEEEATEFLAVRPPSSSSGMPPGSGKGREAMSDSSPALRARGRAVPLEGQQQQSQARSAEKPDRRLADAPDAADPPRAPHPRHRGIAADEDPDVTDAPHRRVDKSASASSTTGLPRITRIPMAGRSSADPAPTAHKPEEKGTAATDTHDESSEPIARPSAPAHRPLPPRADVSSLPAKPVAHAAPTPFKREPSRTNTRPATTKIVSTTTDARTAESETADGTLVVEVPSGALVFLDGVERGRGPQVKVEELDRYAKHAVRIHASGYLPWSGSVSLEGRTAAKIRPTLKKRP